MYYIERLLDRRKVGRGWSYLVKWRDYDTSEATWEPASKLPRAVVQEYLDSL
ncbi:MAG: chromo domain-containing protein [Acinetobacter pittii]